MSKTRNEIGNRYGRLLVISMSKDRYRGAVLWLCKCDCGNIVEVRGTLLRSGHNKSCGCLINETLELNTSNNIKHGCSVRHNITREYKIWDAMIQRCTNMNNVSYSNYGGRGIKVCDRWLESFENFLEDMGECLDGMSIERIDNNGDYYFENCRWATRVEQSHNMRTNVWVEVNGERMIITDAIQMLHISRRRFYKYKNDNLMSHQETIDHFMLER